MATGVVSGFFSPVEVTAAEVCHFTVMFEALEFILILLGDITIAWILGSKVIRIF